MKELRYKGYLIQTFPQELWPAVEVLARVFWWEGNVGIEQELVPPKGRTFETQEQSLDYAEAMARKFIDVRTDRNLNLIH